MISDYRKDKKIFHIRAFVNQKNLESIDDREI